MDRTRASSLESHKNLCDKYDSFSSSLDASKLCKRNRFSSLVGNNQAEYSDRSGSTDFYYNNDYKRPLGGKTDLQTQYNDLQCTVNRMLNGGIFDEIGSAMPSINLSEALKHEYRQMMSALKELESILGCKRKPNDGVNYSITPNNNDAEIHQMQREIYYRDSLIKCLSDRLKVLCKANDKLIIDYENQENILSEELICLKRQLEKAKDALRSLSVVKSRSNISAMQALENEAFYLRESLRNKELMINDLKHRVDKVIRENAELKCELDSKEVLVSHFDANHYDREISYSNRLNEQLQVENDCKSQLIKDLQNKLDIANMANQDHSVVNQLSNELLLAQEENELSKEALLEQSDLLDDFRNQIKILSEHNQFKDDTICELRCCLRQLTECSPTNIPIRDPDRCPVMSDRGSQSIEMKASSINSLLCCVKKYLTQNRPDLLRLLDPECDAYNSLERFILDVIGMTGKSDQNQNDIELFKEFLTNEINLKNSILKFLTSNLTGDIESLEKLQAQMNSILSLDMDQGFKNDLKNYLHNCFLLDDNLRIVIEYLVKFSNSIANKNQALSNENLNLVEKYALYVPNQRRDIQSIDTNSRLTSILNSQENDAARESAISSQRDKIKTLEDEIKIMRDAHLKDKKRFNTELDDKNYEIENLKGKLSDLERIMNEKTRIESELKRLNSEHRELLKNSKEYQFENDRLKGEIEVLSVKNQQTDRNLQMKNSELNNLEVTIRRVSDQFANLSSTQEHVKRSIETIKDAEIERLNKEIEELKVFKNKYNELKSLNNENSQKNSILSKNLESFEAQINEQKNVINALQRELDKSNLEKMELVNSIASMEEEKKKLAEELRLKTASLQLKSSQTDPNNELNETIEKLKRENQQLTKQLQQNEFQEIQLRSSVSNLKIENKTMELRNNSINSDKNALENQIKQLRDRISDLNRNCEENHVSKIAVRSEADQSDMYKQKVVDLEGILVCLTDELNEKVELVDNLRKLVKNDECIIPCADPCAHDTVDINQQLLLQKDSEIAFLKSKIETLERRSITSQSRVPSYEKSQSVCDEIRNLRLELAENEKRIDYLNQQLNERSENLTNLQHLLKEKDEIIDNSLKIIKVKTDALEESEKMLHSMTLENTNIREDLSSRFQDESQLKLLSTTIKNLTNEIESLRTENDKLRSEITKLSSEKQRLSIQRKSSLPPIGPIQTDNSVQQINSEIQKLYIDFEGKSNEIRDYSLKEIKNRDRKIDELNLELKLKSDQFTTIMVENRRLIDKFEDESQRSSKYEQNLQLKEQILEKMLKDKEKIRATFITELHNKNEELSDKNNTVYFLNAELHRLASEIEILNSELQVVKISDNFQVQSKNTLEITQTNLENLKTENNSLRLCINLKTAELESMKNELTIKQIQNEKLSNEIEFVNSKSKDLEIMRRDSVKSEDELKNSIEQLTSQLREIQENYRNLMQTKSTLESALKELENENSSLKQTKELLENEKADYKTEILELQSKIEILTSNLVDTKNQIVRTSMKSETEQHEIKRLSEVIQTNEKSINNQSKTLNQAIQQIDELTEENLKYKMELEKISNQFYELEEEYRILSGKLEKSNEELKAKETQIQHYKDMENDLNGGLKRKSIDCEQLQKEYDCILKQCEEFQEKFDQLGNIEQEALRTIEQKDMQCICLQENLDYIQKQLYSTDEKLKCCNSQWLEKYGQLKCNYEQLECQYLQIQNQLETLNRDRQLVESTFSSHNNKLICLSESYHKLTEENSQLMQENCLKDSELERLCCEKSQLEKCNMDLSDRIESIGSQLRNAHMEICDLTNQLHDSQLKVDEISLKIKDNLSSVRHYGSHPSLNNIDICNSEMINFEHRDYCDLKTRYSSLCCQIDNLINQLKKKDKRIMELQKEKELICRNLSNYEQIQCDYQDLDCKYQQLKDDYSNLSHYYQNINFSHNQKDFDVPNHEINVIQGCADELQETIECHSQEIEELKLSQQALENDYRFCCNRVKELEDQIRLDNIELEKWNQSYYDSENNHKLLEEKFDQLKYDYDDAVSQLHQLNDLKQDLIDKTNRINEITNINDNVEQQIMKAHQQINNQNLIIENYKSKLTEMELYYEREIGQYQHELKSAEQSNPPIDYQELVNCLKDKNQAYECDLMELQNKYHKQNLNFNELRNEQECLLIKTEQLKQEFDQQCANIDKLSGQLFDKNDLIEQMTAENHQLNSELELNHLKLCQLTEQNECLNQFLKEKNNELIMSVENGVAKERESIELSNHAEYLTDQLDQRNNVIDDFKKELSINYDTIEELKQENSKLCCELEKLTRIISENDQIINSKNELLNQYSKELEVNYELINKLQTEPKQKSSISGKEFFEMKQMNEKLNEELEYLHRKLDPNIQSTETQTQKDKNQTDLNPTDYMVDSPSPISEFRPYNERDSFTKMPSEENQENDLTYSTSKSVAWKSTHTDQPEIIESGVLELQKAIDEYNTLVTSIELSEGALNLTGERESTRKIRKFSNENVGKKSASPDVSTLNPKIDIDFHQIQETIDEVDVIVVDLDSMQPTIGMLAGNVPIDVQTVANEETVQHFHQANFQQVIDILKNCNVKIDFDDTKETFDVYLQRMMQKYSELEQFYLASMKINLDILQDPVHIQNLDIFTELYEKSRQKLIQNCQLLKSSIAYNVPELHDEVQSINDQRLTIEDLTKFVDLVTTQQLQLGALKLTHTNLQNITPIAEDQSHIITPTYVNQEYQKLWLTTDVCDPNIVTEAQKANQLSLDRKLIQETTQRNLISAINTSANSIESENVLQDFPNDTTRANVINPKLKSELSKEYVLEENALEHKLKSTFEDLADMSIEQPQKELFLKTSIRVTRSSQRNDTRSINFPQSVEENYTLETIENEIPLNSAISNVNPSLVEHSNAHMNSGQQFEQNISKGSGLPESKTRPIDNLENKISYASIGQFEKELHQLNNIDFDNLDSSIVPNDRMRIYAAEIDYLNEKNLFHTYAINSITNPTRYPINTEFLHQITTSLTSKAKFIDTLRKEFQFDPHITNKEKELIERIVDPKNDFTFEKLFITWINQMGVVENQKHNEELAEKVKELTKKLEFCQSEIKSTDKQDSSKLIETLIAEKKLLSDQLNDRMIGIGKTNSSLMLKSPGSDMEHTSQQLLAYKSTVEQLTKENEHMKEILKYTSDKGISSTQEFSLDKSKQSKIPLLKGSTIEGSVTNVDRKSMKWEDVNKRLLNDMTNISKNINQVTESVRPFKNTDNNADELAQISKEITNATTKMNLEISEIRLSRGDQRSKKTSSNNDKSLLQSAGKLVSPEDVKSAIESETSIESLKKFACLLAEDNFDLAAEIEKLLVTIEELRRQLKENCEILSETVDMLQNSENFVNQLEKKLNIETKKTQVITTRIDKLNELNGKVILEIERILKQPPSTLTNDMNSQEKYDYLFECLKKIEAENLNLLNKKEQLENELLFIKSSNTYNFLGPILTGPIDFEFETSLSPNGSIEGTINMRNNDDISKKLSLTFDVNMNKDDKLQTIAKNSKTLGHFLIEQEAAHPEKRSLGYQSNKTKTDDNSNNNNCNNSCCCYRDAKCCLSKSLIDIPKLYSPFDKTRRTRVNYLNKNPTNYRSENLKPTSCHSNMQSDLSLKIMSSTDSILKFDLIDLNKSSLSQSRFSTSSVQSSQSNIDLHSWKSMSSVSGGINNRNVQFINYRKPIYFRSICDRL